MLAYIQTRIYVTDKSVKATKNTFEGKLCQGSRTSGGPTCYKFLFFSSFYDAYKMSFKSEGVLLSARADKK